MRKKMFVTLCCAISVIFLLSYCLIYFIFRGLLMEEIREKQENLLKFNETTFTNYVDSFHLIPFQFISNEKIGDAVQVDSPVYLDMFRARETIRRELGNYFNLLVFTSNIDGRIILYLNQDSPLHAYCDQLSLSERPSAANCQVYADTAVKNEEWYRRAMEITWSPYFFLNKETNELCYAKCAQNYYLQSPSQNGVGMVVISIPLSAFLDKLSLNAVTPNSSVFILNEYQDVLYQQGPLSASQLTDTELSLRNTDTTIQGEKYIINTASVKDDLYLTFLTPYADIEEMIHQSLHYYVVFSGFTIFVLILIIYIISRRITAPIISFAELLGKIEDTRSFDTTALSGYTDAELRVLCNSFCELIDRENTLIDQIDEENRAKRTAVLHALQAQINPHFLYNALDIVSWLALSRHEDTIADVVSSISNMMHYSISHPDAAVTLQQELDNIQEFIRISQLESAMQVELSVDVENQELLTAIKIPKFTLQPLVENAILHNPDKTSLSISIAIEKAADCLSIRVTDNGDGADPAKLNAFLNYEETDLTVSNGFGIRNVNERLQLHYSESSCLYYSRTPEGYLTATLLIREG